MQQAFVVYYGVSCPTCHLNFHGILTFAQKLLIAATKHTQVTCEMLCGTIRECCITICNIVSCSIVLIVFLEERTWSKVRTNNTLNPD